jgi:hypothetical protein
VHSLTLWPAGPAAANHLISPIGPHNHVVHAGTADRLQRHWSAGSGAGRSRHGGVARHAVRDMIPVRGHGDTDSRRHLCPDAAGLRCPQHPGGMCRPRRNGRDPVHMLAACGVNGAVRHAGTAPGWRLAALHRRAHRFMAALPSLRLCCVVTSTPSPLSAAGWNYLDAVQHFTVLPRRSIIMLSAACRDDWCQLPVRSR